MRYHWIIRIDSTAMWSVCGLRYSFQSYFSDNPDNIERSKFFVLDGEDCDCLKCKSYYLKFKNYGKKD